MYICIFVLLFSLVSCPNLNGPTNGGVSVNGTTATYTCDDGYELIGNETRSCQSDERWSGQEPTCTKAGQEPTLNFNLNFNLLEVVKNLLYSDSVLVTYMC